MTPVEIITNTVDIFLVAFFIFWLLKIFSGSRAVQLMAGLVALFIIYWGSIAFNLQTIAWVLNKALPVTVIILVIVFQPELRRTLERIGRNFWLAKVVLQGNKSKEVVFLNKIINAVEYLSKNKIGAIIAIERLEGLEDFSESGLALDAVVSEDLLISIFNTKSPLHDGAVLVRGDRLAAARVFFPLTKSTFVDQRLGTRHKAAIGLSEISDALIIVVSESNGIISMAEDGTLVRYMARENLEERLLTLFQKEKRKISVLDKFRKKG